MHGLIASGKVSRGALGVKLQPEFPPEDAAALGLDRPRGAWVDAVDKASPAALAGLRVGDVILRFNGVDVADLNHLINLVSMAPIGQRADLVIWRDRKEQALRVTVADKDTAAANIPPRPSRPMPGPANGVVARPNAGAVVPAGAAESSSVLGLELVTLDAATGPRLGLPGGLVGAVVTKVEPESPMAAYFRPLDVLSTVGGRPIKDANSAVHAFAARGQLDHLEVIFQRPLDGNLQKLRVRLP